LMLIQAGVYGFAIRDKEVVGIVFVRFRA
jgi:hypothetical protein